MDTEHVTRLVNELKKLNNKLNDYVAFRERINPTNSKRIPDWPVTVTLSYEKYALTLPKPEVEHNVLVTEANVAIREESIKYLDLVIGRIKTEIQEIEQQIRNS